MKIAITGASGHVGNHLCKELLKNGSSVKVLIHKNLDELPVDDIEIIKGDILDNNSTDKLCSDVDLVYHLAAKISIDKKEKDLVYDVNVKGTQNIIRSCLKHKVSKLIHFSSIHTLSHEPFDQVMDENRPLINSTNIVYEQSKTDGEKLVLKAIKSGLNAVILTPTAIVGPYDYKPSLLGQALIKIYLNKLSALVPGGYDWVDVRDVVNAAIQAIEKGRNGERYIISGNWLSLKEISKLTGKLTNRRTPNIIVPSFLAKIGLPFISLYSKIKKEHPLYTQESLNILNASNKTISSQKAMDELDHQTRPFENTLKDTFEWYKKNGLV